MVIVIFFAFFALYFFYLYKWVQSCLAKEYHFASPSPPETLPHSAGMSVLVGIVWGLTVVAGVFWGFTYNRYPKYFSLRDMDTEMYLLIAMCIGLALSYIVIYHLGELKGIAEMKNTELFRNYEDGGHGI